VAVELAAPLLVLPDELIDALVGNALNPLSGGVPDDLLGAVVLYELSPDVGFNADREALSLGLDLVASLGLTMG
jgi:hypothetical protein